MGNAGNCIGINKSTNINKEKRKKRLYKTIRKSDELDYDMIEYDMVFGSNQDENDSLAIKIQLYIECESLYKFKKSQKGNFQVILYNLIGNELVEEGRTEVSQYTFDPIFIKKFTKNYKFADETIERLFFHIYHIDNEGDLLDLTEQTFIGEAVFTLKNLVMNKFQEVSKALYNEKYLNINLGNIKIKAIQSQDTYKTVSVQFGIRNLVSKHPICLKVWQKSDLDKWRPICITNSFKQEKVSQYWEESMFLLSECLNEKQNSQLKFEIFEIYKEKFNLRCELQMTSIDFIGRVLKDEKEKEKEKDDKLIDEYLMKSKSEKIRNFLLVKKLEIKKIFRFYDYLVSRLEMKTFIFMDMTRSKVNQDYYDIFQPLGNFHNGSNDDIDNDKNNMSKSDTSSITNNNKKRLLRQQKIVEEKLQFINRKDEFLICLDTLLKFIFEMDTSKNFPFFCFGSKLPPLFDNLSNCFSSTMDMLNPEVEGYYGFFDTYTNLIKDVEIYGPANLSESLENLGKFMLTEKFDENEQFYVIAVFIVSSRITDLIHSIKLINGLSEYPCSIIVIGIGYEYQLINNENFEEYEYLNRLTDEKTYEEIMKNYKMFIQQRPKRRNSIFIDFYSLYNDYDINLRKESIHKPIIKRLFKEISNQFLSYVRYKNIDPIDYINLNRKSHANFIEFRNEKINEDYSIPHFLVVEKRKIEERLMSIGFSLDEINKYIPTMPSFEINYLLSMLNYNKYLNDYEDGKKKNLEKDNTKKMIMINGCMLIDERELILKMKKDNNEKEKKDKFA